MYGILNEENKFILLDTDREKVRVTALMLSKEEAYVDEIEDENGNIIQSEKKTRYIPMFTEETVDDAIQEFSEEDIITVEGNFYLAGYAPEPSAESIIAKDEEYLKSTDWYAIRFADTGEEIPADIKKARQEARDEISKLRGGE